MALPTSGAPTAAQWNTEFNAIATALDGVNDNEKADGYGNQFSIGKTITDANVGGTLNGSTPSKYTSLFFTAPSNLVLVQLGISLHGTSGRTGTIELRPVVEAGASAYATEITEDLLQLDSAGNYPSESLTTSGTAPEYSEDGMYANSYQYPEHFLVAGRRYELRLTLSGAVGGVSYFATFADWPSR